MSLNGEPLWIKQSGWKWSHFINLGRDSKTFQVWTNSRSCFKTLRQTCLVDNPLRVLTLSVRLNKQQKPFTKITRSSNRRCPDRSGQIPDSDSIANMFKYRMILSVAHKLKLMRKQRRGRRKRKLLIFQMTSVSCWCEAEALVMPVWNGYSTLSMETCPIVFHNGGEIKDAALCPAGRSAVRRGDAPHSLHSFVRDTMRVVLHF